MTVRVSDEILWRAFRVGPPVRRLLKKIQTAQQKRYDRIGDAGSAWSVLLGGFRMDWVVPTIWSHNPPILGEALDDPMYNSRELH